MTSGKLATEETTSREFDLLHERMTAVEIAQADLKSDTEEIVEWIRNGKLAGKVAAKSFSYLGMFIMWVVKVVGAAAVLYAAADSLKQGKFPGFRLWP